MVTAPLSLSSEREHVRLDPGVEELDLEQSIADRRGLVDQLIHPLVVGNAVAVLVDIDAVRAPRWLAVEVDAESHRRVRGRRPHHEMKVTGMEAIRDGANRFIEAHGNDPDRPVTRQRPLIATQRGWRGIDATFVGDDATGRRETHGALVAHVALR